MTSVQKSAKGIQMEQTGPVWASVGADLPYLCLGSVQVAWMAKRLKQSPSQASTQAL